MSAVDWRAVLAELLSCNSDDSDWKWPTKHLEPFLEVLREVQADQEMKYARLRAERKASDREKYRELVVRMKPIWDEKRAKYGKPPVDIDAEVERMMRE